MSETAIEIARHVQATRYLNGAGLVVLLYDHLLTFPAEIDLIWAAHCFPLGSVLSGIANSHVSSTLIPNPSCTSAKYRSRFQIVLSPYHSRFELTIHGPPSPSSLAPLESLGTNSACRLLHLGALRPDRDSQCDVYDYRGASNEPYVFFEVVALSAMVYNALSRPRSSHTDVSRILYRDGIIYFLILFLLRLMNLLLASAAPVSLIFLGVFFIWCSTTVTVTRLILNLRKMRARTSKLQDGYAIWCN
ncbi:hypothetical protein DFS33DRAFT_1456261 [Desarmillaria ectypa]|nr:hypothetical protein DFS33DRAFT_1456261 [Desarmillaria ectypa]